MKHTKFSIFLFVVLFFLLLANNSAQSAKAANDGCVPAAEYIPFAAPDWGDKDRADYQAPGYYQRMSPDGRFVIRSFSGAGLGMVSLLEIKKSSNGELVAVPYKTDLANEAFALLSTFRFVVDIDGKHYQIKDIIESGPKAKSRFRAGAIGVYAASTELAGGKENDFTIRSIAWPGSGANDDSRGTGVLYMMESRVTKEPGDLATASASASASDYKVRSEKRYELCKNLKNSEGRIYTTPMISISGDEFAARPLDPADKNPSMRIYKILPEGKCEKVADLGVESEKAYFGVNSAGKPAPLLFVNQGLHLWDRETDLRFNLASSRKPFQITGFPSMTKDGRVMVAAKWNECPSEKDCKETHGYIRLDPNQSEDVLAYKSENPKRASWMKKCILESEVRTVEQEQAQIYGLSSLAPDKLKIPATSQPGTR